MSVPGPQEEEGGEQGERDGTQPVHQHPVVQEDTGHDQPGDVGGQHRLAARLGGQPAEREQDHQQQLDLGLGHAVAEMRDRQPDQRGQQQHRDHAYGDEHEQQPAVAGE
jgi:hypothetical protein